MYKLYCLLRRITISENLILIKVVSMPPKAGSLLHIERAIDLFHYECWLYGKDVYYAFAFYYYIEN